MSKAKVYCGGPVAGLTWDEAMAWRREAGKKLADYGLEAVFPMEKEVALQDAGPLPATGVDTVPGCSAEEIFESDLDALRGCDYLLVNLIGAKQPSLGTAWELGFAWENPDQISVVAVEKGSIHDHIFITQGCDQVVRSLDAAIKLIVEWEQRTELERRPTDSDLLDMRDDEIFMVRQMKVYVVERRDMYDPAGCEVDTVWATQQGAETRCRELNGADPWGPFSCDEFKVEGMEDEKHE